MKKCLLFLFLIMLILIVNAGISYADIKRGFELSLYGGAIAASGGTILTVDKNREIKTEIAENGFTGGIRAAYNFNPYLAFEISFEPVSTNEHKIILTETSDVVSDEISEFEGFFHGNVTLHLLKGRFVPFVTAGGGWILFVDDASSAINYGGGLKIFILDRVALRFDVREFNTGYNGSIGQIRETNAGRLP